MAAADGNGQAVAAKRRRALPGKTTRGSGKKQRVASTKEAAADPVQKVSAPAQPVAVVIKAEAAEAAPAGALRRPIPQRVNPATSQLPATVTAAAPEHARGRPVKGGAAASALPAATAAAAVAKPGGACAAARAPTASARTPDTARAAMRGGMAAAVASPDSVQGSEVSHAFADSLLGSDSLAVRTPAQKEAPLPAARGEQIETTLPVRAALVGIYASQWTLRQVTCMPELWSCMHPIAQKHAGKASNYSVK